MQMRLLGAMAAVALALLLAPSAPAQECCDPQGKCCHNGRGACHACAKCGCQLVCDVKEEKKTVWVVKCESMCTILPGCGPAEKVCASDACGQCGDNCAHGGVGADGKVNGCACLVPPKCGRERNIKKLEKKEITVKKPVYKCVACGCEMDKGAVETTPPAPVAPPKAPAPKAPVAPAPKPSATTMNGLPAAPADAVHYQYAAQR